MAQDKDKRVNPQVLDRVFDKIVKENKAGTLLISDGINEKCLYFTMTGLRMISSGNRKTGKIGQMLLTMEAIDQETLDEALFKQQKGVEQKKKKKQLLGEILEENQKIAHQELVAGVRKQVENEILDIYYWPEGVYEFTEGPAPSKFYDEQFDSIVLNVSLREFIEEIRNKINEFRKVTHPVKNIWNTFELTPQAREKLSSGALKEHKYLTLLQQVDGQKNVAQLSYGTIRNLFETAKILGGLMGEGLLNMIQKPPAGPVDFVTSLKGKSRSQVEEEMEDLAAAIDRAINAVLVHNRLAQSNEVLNRPEEAAKHYREVGEINFQKENYDDSLEAFESAKKLDPNDFASQQKMMKIYEFKKQEDKLIEMGLELGRRFLDNGLFNKAKQLFQWLSTKKPEDVEVRKQLLDSYVGLGDKEGAKKEMEEVGQILKKSGRQEDYLQLLNRMVELNVADQKIRKALNSALGRQFMWMVTILVSGVGTILLALLAYYYFNEYNSVAQFNTAVVQVQDLLYRHQYDEALQTLQKWYSTYPSSSATQTANDILQEIQARKQAYSIKSFQYEKAKIESEPNPKDRRKRLEKLLNHPLLKQETGNQKIIFEKEDIKKSLEIVTAYIERFEQLFEQAKSLRAQSPRQSYEVYQRLIRTYPDFAETKNFKVPYLITSNPIGATITLLQTPPKVVGVTGNTRENALVIETNPLDTLFFSATLPGYNPISFQLDLQSAYQIDLSFRKEPNWTFQTEGHITAPLTEKNGILYFTSSDGIIYALNGTNGALLWKAPLGASGESVLAPLVYENFLVIGTLGGQLFCFQRDNGKLLAQHFLETPQELPYFATEQGLLVLKKGSLLRYPLWQAPKELPTVLRNDNENYSTPIVSLEEYFVLASQDMLHFFEGNEFTTVKTKRSLNGTISGNSFVEFSEKNVLEIYAFARAPHQNNKMLYKYGIETKSWRSKFRWSWPATPTEKELFIGDVLGKAICSSRSEIAHLLLFASTDHHLYALDKDSKSGQMAWHYTLGGPVHGDLTLNEDGNELYVPCLDQNVYVFRITPTQVLLKQKYPIPSPVYSNVALVQNQVIIAGYDGTLYSFTR